MSRINTRFMNLTPLALGALLLTGAPVAQAQVSSLLGPAKVEVANPPNKPVPVTGTVNLSGTPSVNATLSGPVRINDSIPPRVRDADLAARQAFRFGKNFFFRGIAFIPESGLTVPEGKLLVIESVYVRVSVLPDEKALVTLSTCRDPDNREDCDFYPLTLSLQGRFGPRDEFRTVSPVLIYVAAGEKLNFRFDRSQNTDDALQPYIGLSGHFVDLRP
ncbi:MAG: hypothetical protein ACT4QA_19050 [Panacagrimonas sp.]